MPRGGGVGTGLANLRDVSGTGIIAHTAAATWATRTITGTADEIDVTNGDGVSDNPTLSLPTTVHINEINMDSGTTVTIAPTNGSNPSLVLTDGTTAVLTLGTDGGDDFAVSDGTNNILVVSGDTARVGINVDEPLAGLHVDSLQVEFMNGTNNSPDLRLRRADTEITNGNVLGTISFTGDDAAAVDTRAAQIRVAATGAWASGDNPTRMEFYTTPSGSSTPTERIRIEDDGQVVIGTNVALGQLHVFTADSGATANANADEIVAEGSGNSGVSILSGNSSFGCVFFGDDGDNNIGQLRYDHTANYMAFYTNAAETMRLDNAGNLGVGKSPGSRLDLSLSTEDLEIVDAGSAGATEQDWIEVQVGNVTGYIRVFATV